MIAKSQLLASHTLMTFLEAGVGFVVGSVSAILTAVLFLWFRPLKEMFYPYAVILNSTPIVAIAAPIVIIFGSGMSSKVVTAVICVFFPVLGPTFKALASVGATEMKWMDSYHSSRWQKFRHLQFPFALPQIFASFKVAWTLAVIGAVVGEVFGAYRGLGFLIVDAIYIMDTPGCLPASSPALSWDSFLSASSLLLKKRRWPGISLKKGNDSNSDLGMVNVE